MTAFVELLGEQLLSQGGQRVATVDALAGKTVGLYFSARWCPPCRGFTPELAKSYSNHLAAKGLEIVFVSSDRDQASFDDYFGHMPWKALPFEDRTRKNALSKQFKVQGIPSFIILDQDGQVITREGRDGVDSDPEGARFPWRARTLAELLEGPFVGQGGSSVDASSLQDKVIGLYFSAHWCGPCRGFTPQLAAWYRGLQPKQLPFEIIFVSSDRDESSFKEYFAEMPWLALPFEKRDEASQLSNLMEVSGIPTFVILDRDRSVITTNGRGIPQSDAEGARFPWYPPLVGDIADGCDNLNEKPCVIAMMEGSDDATVERVTEALKVVAEEVKAAAKAAGEEVPFGFYIAAATHGPAPQIRKGTGLPAVAPSHKHPVKAVDRATRWGCDGCQQMMGDSTERYRCVAGCDFDFCGPCFERSKSFVAPAPCLLLLDLPSEGAVYQPTSEEISSDSVRQLLAAFKAGQLARKQWQR